MSINVELLSKICEAPGAPGHEQRIRQLILKEIKGKEKNNGSRSYG
jgi:endoglucanase